MARKMDDMGEAIPVLRQNLEEEESVSCWLWANTPASFAQLWPEIEAPSPATRETKEVGTKVGDTA